MKPEARFNGEAVTGRGEPPQRWSAYLLLFPIFVARLLYLAVLTLLPIHLLARGFPAGEVALVVASYGYAAIATDLVAGALADRFSPKRLSVVGIFGVAGGVGLLSLSSAAVLLGAARLVHGLAMGLFRPAIYALLFELVPAHRRAFAFGLAQLAYVGGALAGPLGAGLVADAWGLDAALQAATLLAVAAAVYLAVAVPAPLRPAPPVSIARSLARLPTLVLRRQLVAPLVVVFTDLLLFHIWLVFLPAFLVGSHGYGLAAAGLLVSTETLFYALAQPLWGRLLDRYRSAWLPFIALLAYAATVTVVPVAAAHWWALPILFALGGMLDAAVYPGAVMTAVLGSDPAERGRVMGVVSAASDLGQAIGPLVAGGLYLATMRYDAIFAPLIPLAAIGVFVAWLAHRRTPLDHA